MLCLFTRQERLPLKIFSTSAFSIALTLLSPVAGFAFPFTFTASGTGTGGNAVSAQVDFSVTGSAGNYQLVVKLTNTATRVGKQQGDFLSGVFFDITGNPTLTRVSATANALVQANGTVVAGTDVGPHFAYLGGGGTLVPAYGATQGISSGGLGVFGKRDLFASGAANQPGGPDYNILPNAGITDPSNGNVQNQAYVKYFATFTLGGLTSNTVGISNVTFQYGTALSEGHLTGACLSCGGTLTSSVPEPSAMILLGSILCFAGAKIRRSVRQKG